MTSHFVVSVSLGWREPFFWRRIAAGLLLAFVPFAVCLAFKAGFLALAVLSLGSYPWPIQVVIDEGSVALSWLFVSQRFSASELIEARLTADTRRWSWPRRPVLLLERRGKRPVLFFGRKESLARLVQRITQSLESSRRHVAS